MRILMASLIALTTFASACGSGGATKSPPATATINITASAGPVCPVETDPPSPDCAPRPVAGAVIVALRADATEAARTTTGPDGAAVMLVEAGALKLVPQPVEGLVGTASPVDLTVSDSTTSVVHFDYDTGIR